jgi:hypothetical protein
MIGFLFEVIIALLVCGLFFYLVRWIVGKFGLPEPIVVVVGVLILIAFLYWCYQSFPVGGFPHHSLRR